MTNINLEMSGTTHNKAYEIMVHKINYKKE